MFGRTYLSSGTSYDPHLYPRVQSSPFPATHGSLGRRNTLTSYVRLLRVTGPR